MVAYGICKCGLTPTVRQMAALTYRDVLTDAKSCIAQRDMFRELGNSIGSAAFMMKYQPGFEDGIFRGKDKNVSLRSDRMYDKRGWVNAKYDICFHRGV